MRTLQEASGTTIPGMSETQPSYDAPGQTALEAALERVGDRWSLLLVDALRMRFRTIQLRRDAECPACGTRELKGLIDYDEFCGTAPAWQE